NGADGADSQMGVVLDERIPELCRPGCHQAVDGSRRRAGIIVPVQSLGETEEVTGMNHPDDDLLAVASDLRDLEPAVKEQIENRGRIALLEDGLALWNPPCTRFRAETLELLVIHGREEGNLA